MSASDLTSLFEPLEILRKNPEKTSPRKRVPTGDRTRARCVTGAHATTWSTAVDVRLVGSDIWTRDLPNASIVRYHEATSLCKNVFWTFYLKPNEHGIFWNLHIKIN